MGKFLKQTKNYHSSKNKIDIHNVLTITFLLACMAILISLNSLVSQQGVVLAQVGSSSNNQILKAHVQIINNSDVNDIGSVHVIADGTGVSKDLTNISFPASKTVTHIFEFDSEDIPVGTGFSIEVVYGDDVHKRACGVNSESNIPEILDIVIP